MFDEACDVEVEDLVFGNLRLLSCLSSDLRRGRTVADLGIANSGMKPPSADSHSADLSLWPAVAYWVLPSIVSTKNTADGFAAVGGLLYVAFKVHIHYGK